MSKANLVEFSQPLLPGIDSKYDAGSELLESEESQRARFSGKIVEKNQARVASILAARAMDYSIRQICETFSISPHTLAAIEDRHRVKLATLKQKLARKFGVFLELGIDRAIAEVDRMDRDKLLVALGIAADKLQVLTGEASVIVGSPTGEGARFTVDGLRNRLQARPCIDVTATATGSEARETPANARDAQPARSASPST